MLDTLGFGMDGWLVGWMGALIEGGPYFAFLLVLNTYLALKDVCKILLRACCLACLLGT
jgi:hypothetical protein